jgi:hypothetical protein
MTQKPMAVAALCATLATGCGAAPSNPCEFRVVTQTGQPSVLGTNELRSRTLVPMQPDSPVRVVQVDLNGVDTILGSGLPPGSYGVQVRNVSDKPVSNITVAVSFLLQQEGGTLGSRLDGPLDPGETSWIRGLGNVRVAPADADKAKILVAVESAESGSCFYKPAQVIPLGWVPHRSAVPSGLSR